MADSLIQKAISNVQQKASQLYNTAATMGSRLSGLVKDPVRYYNDPTYNNGLNMVASPTRTAQALSSIVKPQTVGDFGVGLAKNLINTASFGIANPWGNYTPQTTAGKIGSGLGFATGFLNNPLGGAMNSLNIGGKVVGVVAPKALGLAPKIAGGLISEAAQTGVLAGASKLGNMAGLNDTTGQFDPKNLATQFGLGTLLRGAANSPQLPAIVSSFKQRSMPSVDPIDKGFMTKAIDYARLGKKANGENLKMEAQIRDMVDQLVQQTGIKAPKTLAGAADLFDKTLQATKYDMPNFGRMGITQQSADPLIQEAKKYRSAEEFSNATPRTARVWINSKFSKSGSYVDVPVIRKEENITLYQGGQTGDKRQFWTPDKKYAEQFGNVKEKTGTFYKIDNGNRVTDVYIETPTKSRLQEIWNQANQKLPTGVMGFVQGGDSVINEAKKQISKGPIEPKATPRQVFDELYTKFVDSFHPIVKLTKSLGEIPTKNSPIYQIKRYLGAAGIAESRFQNELRPIIDELDSLKIDKGDLDVYLKARRDMNLASRGIFGSDASKASQVINAIDQKYGQPISQIADKLYQYQSKGFAELAQDFLGSEKAKLVTDANVDYVPFQRVMDKVDNFLGIPSAKLQQGTNPVAKIKGSEKAIYSPLESIITNTYKQRAAIEKNNVAKSIVGLVNMAPDIGFKKVSKSGSNTISVWRNGVKEYWEVGKEIADVVKGLNEEQATTIEKLISIPSQWLRQGATGRNLDFMVPNMIRDQFEAATNSKYGYRPFVDYMRGFMHLLKQDYGGGDELYRQWMESGGAQSFGSITGRKSAQEFLGEKQKKTLVKQLVSWATEGIDTVGRYSETPTRLGLFERGLKATGDVRVAMMESREGTLDFARMGSKMKLLNQMIPFLNVGVQGFDKLIRTAVTNPGQFMFKMGAYAAVPTMAISAYNHTYYPNEYREIPDYVKDTNFVIIKGRNEQGTVDYFTIPKANSLQLLANPIEKSIAFFMDTNSQTVPQALTSLISSALPVVGDGQSLKEVGIKTIGQNLPQAIKPITENLLNKSFFKYNEKKQEASDIVPFYLKDKPPAEQAYKFTEDTYKVLGRLLNTSPLQIKNLAEGYFAGGVKTPINIIETLHTLANGGDVDKNKLTILRRFMGTTYQTGEAPKPKETSTSSLATPAQAAEDNPGVLSYIKANGKKKSVDVGAVSSLPETNNYELAIKKRKSFLLVDDILDGNFTPQEKVQALNRLGIKPEEAQYYNIARQPNDIKMAYLEDQASKIKTRDEFMKMLGSMRHSVNNQVIASDSIIDKLKKDGVLTQTEANILKSIVPNRRTGGVQIKRSLLKAKKGKKIKVPKIKTPKSVKIKFKKTNLKRIML